MKLITIIGGAAFLAACTAVPQERMTTGAEMGIGTGCAIGALATVWSGPGALLGCGLGAGMAGMVGMDLGLLTTPIPPLPPPAPQLQ
jgi:hypothetical protein